MFNRYSFVKLSNLVVMSEQVFRRAYRSSTAQRIKDPFSPEQTIVSSIQALQIVDRIIQMNEIRSNDTENLVQHSEMSSSSSSSNESSEPDSDDEPLNDQSTLATSQNLFDINRMNSQTLDDYAGMDGFVRRSQSENIVMAISEPMQSTPELIINVLKQPFAENARHCSLQMYPTIMQLLTTMHFVKLNDKSQRAQSTVTLLVPRIQAMQHNVEKLILAFMRKLSRTAGTSIPLQDPALFQMTCQVRSIEQQIKRLNHARAIVLKREYLSENHVRQLKAELFRAMQLTYGYPRIVQTGKLNTRQ